MQKTCKHVNLCALSSHLMWRAACPELRSSTSYTRILQALASYKYANPTGNPRANMLKVVVMDITPNPPAIPTNAL